MNTTCYIASLAISRDPSLNATVVYIPGKNFEIFDGGSSTNDKILKILKDVCHVEDEVLKNCQKIFVPSPVLDELIIQAGKAETIEEMDGYVMPIIDRFKDRETVDLLKAAEGAKQVNIVDAPVQKPAANQPKKKQPQKQIQKVPQPQQNRGPNPATPIVLPLDPDRNNNLTTIKTTISHITAVCRVKDKEGVCVVLIGPTSKFFVTAPYEKVCTAIYGS